ncbi:hypothetical protein ACFT0G_10350 [Streptomyces sp. NPDC057020]|uniref:hypothetical protein n=1 Tax=unclassified Streptomyces TaxID=2593676 RepID=UPI00363B8098
MLRAVTVRAAWHDRRDGDLPLLRLLLEHENPRRTDWYRERRLAALLVAAHGRAEDVPLLRAATHGAVTDSAGGVAWATAAVPEDSEFTWVELTHRQGRVEHARVALIRMPDDTGRTRTERRRSSPTGGWSRHPCRRTAGRTGTAPEGPETHAGRMQAGCRLVRGG